ncbi:major intrinsically disordered NOTCH2-binding receptor 1-like [Stigmatopora argus]
MVTPVLPNNNHPLKFLKLDVTMPPLSDGTTQVGALRRPNRECVCCVLEQRAKRKSSPTSPEDTVAFVDRYVTPGHLRSNMKANPLYATRDVADVKFSPSWTIKEYSMQMQTTPGQVADFLQDNQKTPRELDFWLEDLYTPGFDALLKKKEAERRQKRLHRLLCVIALVIAIVIVVVLVPVLVIRNKV